jgi:hypothetical protein
LIRTLIALTSFRSGSITYPEIAKRENVRPPINKVCQKLGVKKVAQMTSDEQLYQAIKSVVCDIEMKRRARQPGSVDEYLSDGSEVPVRPSVAPGAATLTGPPGLTKPSLANSNINTSAGTELSASTAATAEINRKPLEKLPTPPPALQCDSLDLLKVVLAVRAAGGNVSSALQQITQGSDVAPEIAALPSAYVQDVVTALCMLIGCAKLEPTVSHEDTIGAFERYVRQSREANSSRSVSPKPVEATAPAANRRSHNEGSQAGRSPSAQAEPVARVTHQTAPTTNPPGRITSGNTQEVAPRSIANNMLPLEDVYAQFWELSYKLFLYVCNPYRRCSECLIVVEGTKLSVLSHTLFADIIIGTTVQTWSHSWSLQALCALRLPRWPWTL